MIRFLRFVAFVLLGILVVNFIYAFSVDGDLRKYLRVYLNIPEDAAEMVIFGDSHSDRAWDANTNEQIFNFSHGSDNTQDFIYKFSYLKQKGKINKNTRIILSFDPHIVSKYRETMNNNYKNELVSNRLPVTVPYMLPLVFDKRTEITSKQYILKLFSKSKESEKLKKTDSAEFRKRFYSQFPEDEASRQLLKDYQALINMAKANGNPISAIRYPVAPFYYQLIMSHKQSLALLQKMDSLAATNNLKVLDYSKTFTAIELFKDQDHLNKDGSALFLPKVLADMQL